MSSLNLGAIAEGLIDAGASHLKLKLGTNPPATSEFAKGGEAAARELAERLRGQRRPVESIVNEWMREHNVDPPRTY